MAYKFIFFKAHEVHKWPLLLLTAFFFFFFLLKQNCLGSTENIKCSIEVLGEELSVVFFLLSLTVHWKNCGAAL